MKKFLSILLVIVVAGVARVFGGFIADALVPGKPTFEEEIADLADSSPFLHAVFSDHMDEARRIYTKFETTGEEEAKADIAGLLMKYGLSALGRTSDDHAIDVLNKAGVVLDLLSKRYPEGCKNFLGDEIPPGAVAMPEVTQSFRSYLEAKRAAYEDGKSHAPVARLEAADVFEVALSRLDVSFAEVGLLINSDKIPDAQLCSILKRLVNVQAVPETERAAWARGYLSMGAKG